MLDALTSHYPDLTPKKILILSLVFLYPAAAVIIPHAGGVVLIILVLAGMFSATGFHKQVMVWEKRVFLVFVLFFVLALVSMLNTENVTMGYERLEKLLQLPLAYFAYLYLRKSGLDLFPVFVSGLILAAFVLFCTAIIEVFVQGHPRADGVSYAIFFGDLAVLVSFLILAWVVLSAEVKGLPLYFGMLASLLGLVAALLSGTKGALIYIPAGIVVISFFLRHRFSWYRVSRLVIVLLAFMLAAWLLDISGYGPTARIKSDVAAVTNVEQSSGSTRTRVVLWEIAYSAWRESPLLGTGLGDFRQEVLSYFEQLNKKPIRYNQAHSNIMNVMATMGTVGLIGFLLLSFVPWIAVAGEKVVDDLLVLKAIVAIVVSAFFVFGLTETWTARNMFMRADIIFVVISLCLVFGYKQKRDTNELSSA